MPDLYRRAATYVDRILRRPNVEATLASILGYNPACFGENYPDVVLSWLGPPATARML